MHLLLLFELPFLLLLPHVRLEELELLLGGHLALLVVLGRLGYGLYRLISYRNQRCFLVPALLLPLHLFPFLSYFPLDLPNPNPVFDHLLCRSFLPVLSGGRLFLRLVLVPQTSL